MAIVYRGPSAQDLKEKEEVPRHPVSSKRKPEVKRDGSFHVGPKFDYKPFESLTLRR